MLLDATELMDDIYYQKKYAELYLSEGEELFEFEYTEEDLWIKFFSIKRRIAQVGSVLLDEELYDLETPYGYGGPVSSTSDQTFLLRGLAAYKNYCVQQKIVCEFIRFHPFNMLTAEPYLFDFFLKEREVVLVDLAQTEEERWKQYSKTTRNILRKSSKILECSSSVDGLETFCQLYKQTMDKNSASDFYYFDKNYFSKLLDWDATDLLLIEKEGSPVSMGFFMYGPDIAHYHLSANNSSFSKENGNYQLLDFAFSCAKELNCRWMMLGGGRTSGLDDSLLKFKKKFSLNIKPFYIGGIDFIPEKRKELNALWQKENADSTLQLYQLYRR